MTLDQSRIGQVVAAQMEALERDYPGDEHEIGAVVTIVEIVSRTDEGARSHVRVRSNAGNPYVTLGLMTMAEQTMVAGFGSSDG